MKDTTQTHPECDPFIDGVLERDRGVQHMRTTAVEERERFVGIAQVMRESERWTQPQPSTRRGKVVLTGGVRAYAREGVILSGTIERGR